MAASNDRQVVSIFLIFLRLGLTSFGGPIAHLAYFRDEFVTRRRWLSENNYADLIALCQFLPGPASSQVGIALGLSRSGYAGAFAAWLGFTMPSAIALIVFALGIANYGDRMSAGFLQGLKIAAAAVVAQALWGMARNLCPDIQRITLMGVATCLALIIPGVFGQVGVIVISGFIGFLLLQLDDKSSHEAMRVTISKKAGAGWLSLFVVVLVTLPLLAQFSHNQTLSLIDSFYRTGALVFGGGHVVLPLLQAEVVTNELVNKDTFLAGYGATQAVPGPLFTFSAFLGASMNQAPNGWAGGIIGLLAIFAPSFLLIFGVIPFWERLRAKTHTQTALAGINAGVVGLLLAAFYQPIWVNTIHQLTDFMIALMALIALVTWKTPPWLVVLGCGVIGWAAQFL